MRGASSHPRKARALFNMIMFWIIAVACLVLYGSRPRASTMPSSGATQEEFLDSVKGSSDILKAAPLDADAGITVMRTDQGSSDTKQGAPAAPQPSSAVAGAQGGGGAQGAASRGLIRLSGDAVVRIKEFQRRNDVHVRPDVVLKALERVEEKAAGEPLCVVEVGTAEGKGTTRSLVSVLDEYVKGGGGGFVIHTYEGMVSLHEKAKQAWGGDKRIVLYNEFVVTAHNLERFVFPHIAGPDTDKWPGKGFYANVYKDQMVKVGSGDFGGFFSTPPPCKADLVLIDGTRFSHAGIVASLLERQGIWDRKTVFMIEDDGGNEASEKRILDSVWKLRDATVEPSSQWQDHPWVIFQVDGCVDPASNAPGC